jgi:hypothetical protein
VVAVRETLFSLSLVVEMAFVFLLNNPLANLDLGTLLGVNDFQPPIFLLEILAPTQHMGINAAEL